MPFIRRHMRPRWPPSPCVEDEAASLSRELHGLSYLGVKPGIEGACTRGAIDQQPVLDIHHPPSLVHSMGSSSSDDSNGPPTPPLDAGHEPFFYSINDSRPSASYQVHSPRQDFRQAARMPRLHQSVPNGRSANISRSNGPPASSKPVNPPNSRSKPYRDVTQNDPVSFSRMTGAPTNTVSSALPKRSGSTSRPRPVEWTASVQRSTPAPGHKSDLTAKSKLNQAQAHLSQGNKKPGSAGSTGVLTLAQRIEEKLQRRREQRDSASASQEGQNNQETLVVSPVTSPDNVVPHSGANEKPVIVSQTASAFQSPARALPKVSPAEFQEDDDSDTASFSTAPLSGSKPVSTEAQPPPAKRVVSFLEAPQPDRTVESKHPRVSPGPSRQSSPTRELTRPGPCLLPCPRSVPMAGHQDWSTISGLTHLNICPSCMKQVGKSRFRDFFIPNIPKSRGQKVRCSFSEPWVRLAWLQTIKQGLDHLDMVYDITRPPSGSGSSVCPGHIISDKYWYRVVDTETGMYLPKFNVCPACARNIKILMPSLSETFRRNSTMQERVCDFVADSPRFIQYIDLLDIASNRAHQQQKQQGSARLRPNISEFLSYARRKVVLRDCHRNRQIFGTWHYMPQLPELTVCEDCYDDVVWPLTRANQPIARQFSSTLRLLPGNDPASRCRETSCQLYSPRMRVRFRDAVARNDFDYLERIALRRFGAEKECHARRKELLDDERRGYDCDLELRRNLEEWKRWE